MRRPIFAATLFLVACAFTTQSMIRSSSTSRGIDPGVAPSLDGHSGGQGIGSGFPSGSVRVKDLRILNSSQTSGTLPRPSEPPTNLSSVRGGMGSGASLSISDVAKNPAIVDTSFDALRYGDNAGYSNYWAPPDVQIATSSAYVLEEVNLLGGIWTTQGTHVSTFYLRSFYTTAIGATDRIGDPKVLFDIESSRWFSSILDENTSSVLVAVSSTNDPTGSWYIYTLAAH